MSADDGNRPGREVAYRLFAAEFDDATLSYAESDEERAPNYVISPTGARLNRVFVVGTLTEVSDVNEEMVRARIVDPTGAFVVYAGQYQPEALAFLERAEPPAFVAVTGKARTFEPDDGDRVYSSIRPESLATVDADTRDRWIVGAAERTRDRIVTYAAATELDVHGDELTETLLANDVPRSLAMGVPLAQNHYGTSPGYLDALDALALDALRVVGGEQSQVDPFEYTPSDAARDGVSFATIAAEADRSFTVPADATTDVDGNEERPTNDASAGAAIGTAQPGTTTAETEEPPVETVPSEPSPGESTDDSSTDEETDVDGVDVDESDDDAAVGTASSDDASDRSESSDDAPAEIREDSATGAEEEPADQTPTEVAGEQSAEGSTDAPSEPDSDSDDELGDFDSSGLDEGLYDMADEEREAVEAEYGTEFTTGTEVDDPGEADIEVPEPEAGTGDATDSAFDDDQDEAVDDESDTETDPGAGVTDEGERAAQDGDDSSTDEEQPVDDGEDATESIDQKVDLQTAVVETMTELDDGDGADRSAVVDSVVEETGAATDDVESAIQDALMGGECYEPDDETLKAI